MCVCGGGGGGEGGRWRGYVYRIFMTGLLDMYLTLIGGEQFWEPYNQSC